MQFEQLIYSEVDSTNSEAARLVAAGKISSPTMVFAHRQTAGRGTRGRDWQSTQNNLKVSYVFPVGVAAKHLPKLVYPIALCVRDALAGYLPERTVQIKWPNDILVQGKKISGSLHESAVVGTATYFIAGIGVNIDWCPKAGVIYDATALSELTESPPKASDVAKAIGATLEERVLHWKPEDFSKDIDDFLKRCFALGEDVTISTTRDREDRVTGKFIGITGDGLIRIQTGDDLFEFSSGDIFPTLERKA